ncbi:MAG: NAD-dependent epimerase/dehydratase family protein [Roseobacter sp.]
MTKTVLLTGVSGFIAKHIARALLARGYLVLGSIRDISRADEVRAALAGDAHLDRLKFIELDLMSDAGWQNAMQGIDCIVHTASPFPMVMPKNHDDLIRPALEGTERVLRAAQAAGVKRVILTSSVVAMIYGHKGPDHVIGPDDWTDLSDPAVTAYATSKTQAERYAWDWADKYADAELTVINPGLVLGMPLDAAFGTSLKLIERLVEGRDPALPNIPLPLVDVADVADLHVRALETPASIARRFIAVERVVSLPQLAKHLKQRLPAQRITTRVAPKPLMGVISLFDPALRAIMPQIGREVRLSNEQTQRCFDFKFRSGLDAAEDSARYILSTSQSAVGE